MTERSGRSGFVALTGRPNVGKSTLVNRMIGRKVAIVSDKPQTTRHRIQGILTRPQGQMVLLDTPGIHKPQHLLGKKLVQIAVEAWREVDAVCLVVDAAAGLGGGDRYIAEQLAEVDSPVVVAVNKTDLLSTAEAAKRVEAAAALGAWRKVLPISAATGAGVDDLMEVLFSLMPEGPAYYPPDWVSDRPEEFVVGELVREKLLELTRDEVPHAITVQVDRFEPAEDRELIEIEATVYVERESQRGIVIGKQGRLLREAGVRARREIEALLGTQVYLRLWVKVRRDWRQRENVLRAFGYEAR